MTHETVYDELNDLLAADEGMNDWEVEFIDDMDQRRREGAPLTDNMKAKISQIWDKVCG